MPFSSLVALACIGLLFDVPSVKAFSFTATPASVGSCGNVTVTWSGGTPPYYLTATPIFGSPRNFSIPNSAFSSGTGGSFSTQLAFPVNHQYLLTMSDSTGFGSGGNSEVLTMAGTSSGSCNTTDPGPAFVYQTNDALQQCRQYTFSAYNAAVQPVTIMGIIPGGQAFTLSPPIGPDSFDWTVNVSNGTSIVFIMIDAQGRQGGSSSVLVVGLTDDNTCLSPTSPSSTESPVASSTSTSGSSSGPSSSDNSGPSTGAIVGIVIGALLFIAVVISLVLFCIRRRQEDRNPNNWIEASGAFSSGRRRSVDIDLLAGDEGTNLHPPYADSRNPNSLRPLPPNAYHDNRSSALSHPTTQYSDSFDAQSSSQLLPPGSVITPFTGQPPSTNRGTSRGTKGSMASSSGAPRYIVHHDAEDIPAEEEEEEVVELPPMYKPRVGPSTSGSGSGPASTSGSTAFTDRKEPIPPS